MWRVIHIETTGENIFLETESEYLARNTYKSAKLAVKNKVCGGVGMLGARLECDSDFTGNYEVVDEVSVEDFNESIVKESSLYKTEFPDFDEALYCPDGFKDVSYHNDIMPHVRKEMKLGDKDIEINIWQDYKDVDKREYDSTKQYVFSIVVDGEVIEEFPTDDLNDIKRYVADLNIIVNDVIKKVYENIKIKSVTNKILEGLSVRSVISSVIKESAEFKKGDVVVAKPEFVASYETPKDTLGIVIDYNPDNDYLLLGDIHPEKHAISHTYSMRGEFYRLVKPEEYKDFGLA